MVVGRQIVVLQFGRRWSSGGDRCSAGRHRLVAPGAGRAQRATGSSLQGRPNSATDMGHACPRSLRAFAQNDQQKTAPVYFNLCPHARARGERRQQQGTTCSIGWSRRCEAAPASAVENLRFSEMVVGRQIVVLRFGRRWSSGGGPMQRRSAWPGRPRRRASAASYRVIAARSAKFCN